MAIERRLLRPDLYEGLRPESYIPTSSLELRASVIAKNAHAGVKRMTGDPFWTHPRDVAAVLALWGVRDEEIKAAAWAHDTKEDNENITLEALAADLTDRTAYIVDGVTKFAGSDRETVKKMFTHQWRSEDAFEVGIPLVKLADRTTNLWTLDVMKVEKQREKAWDTLNVYVPLAEALGLWDVKVWLGDRAFPFADPRLYQQIRKQIDSDPRVADSDFIDQASAVIREILHDQNILARITKRVGGYWDLYTKREQLAARGLSTLNDFSAINDVVSLRVEVPNPIDCYTALGIIHTNFGELVDIEDLDDYVRESAANGYQALHTTLNLPNRGKVEIAFETREMQEFNTWGVVSLMRRGITDLEHYALKAVLIENGEKDRVRFVRRSATGLDIAYGINSALGARVTAVEVDGIEQSLFEPIPNAARIHFVTGPVRRAPDPKALDHCLPETRKVIERQLVLADHDQKVQAGRQLFSNLLASRGLVDLEDLGPDHVMQIVRDMECESYDALLFTLGTEVTRFESAEDAISFSPVLRTLQMRLDKNGITKQALQRTTVLVCGEDQPGIWRDISGWIREVGGSIVRLHQEGEQHYTLRVLIKEVSSEGEQNLRERLQNDSRFKTWLVV